MRSHKRASSASRADAHQLKGGWVFHSHDSVLIWVISIFLAIVLVLSVADFVLQDTSWQLKEISSQDTFGRMGRDEAITAHRQVVMYIVGKATELPVAMTLDEKSHLTDVRVLVSRGMVSFMILCILLSIGGIAFFMMHDSKVRMSLFVRVVQRFTVALAILIAILGIGAFTFSSSFDTFHEIFFPQGNWMFSPDSMLITLYPETFFLHSFLRVLGFSLGAVVIGFVSSVMLKRLMSVEHF